MANEALGVSDVGGVQDASSLELDAFGASEMDGGRGVEPNARVAVLVVVPLKEASAKRAAILDRAETLRELRSVLECLELGF